MGALKSLRCSKGHRMADPNLYYRADGQRQCKKCKDLKNKEQEKKRKAALKAAGIKTRRYGKGPRVKKAKPRKKRALTLKQRILAKGGGE